MGVRTSSRAWPALTPEPERELPPALAVLRGGGREPDLAGETARAQRLVLHGRERAYLAWLCVAAVLARGGSESDDPEVARAAEVVRGVLHDQAGLLLGLPGGGERRERAARMLEAM